MAKKSSATTLMDKWAIWIIGVCIMILLFGVGCFVINKTVLSPKVVRLEIRVLPDTVPHKAVYSKAEIDSLIIITKNTLESFQQHFQTETLQKEQEDVYKSFGALLLSVIVGLCGFLGFKSFKDIKDKGEETAREVAAKEAKEVAENKAEKTAGDYLKSQLPEVVEKQFEKSFKQTTVDAIKQSVISEVIPQIIQQFQSEDVVDPTTQVGNDGEPVENGMSPEEMFDQQKHN